MVRSRYILGLTMPVVISLLRGVNIGNRRIKMDALRVLCESLKLCGAQTYVQSGNVVFRTEERGLDALARKMEKAIERRFGFRPDVILRTTADLREVVARNPFAQRRGIEPGKLLVSFLGGFPGPEARERVLAIKLCPEELHLDGRHLYIYFPNGVGQSKIPWRALDKALATSATGRNWNSVTKLLELAEKMESSR